MDGDLQTFVQRVFACPPDTAAAIAARAARRAYAAREVVLRQGDACSETWLVMTGRAQALVYGAEGQMVLLQDYAEGDLFGAIARLDGEPHEANVIAVETLKAALFLATDFLNLIETHSAVGLAVSRLLLKQLRAATGRMVEQTTLTAAGRVYAELLRLAESAEGGRQVIRPHPVFSSLAVRIHSTRETVSREVNKLERRGIVLRDAASLTIVAPERLRGMIR